MALIVAFIWGNSLLPQAQSRLESDFVLRVLRRIFGAHLDQATASHLVRKAAHFTEYALLGFAGAALFLSGRRGLQPTVNVLSLSLAVAVLDESLQLFSDRGAMVTDILLDFSGAVCGVLAFLLVRLAAASIQKKKAAASGD